MTDLTGQRVVCAAIKAEDGSIMIGIRHYDQSMWDQIDRCIDRDKFWRRQGLNQGFVDQWGNWLSRTEAYLVAERNGQITDPDACRTNSQGKGVLFSEGLY